MIRFVLVNLLAWFIFQNLNPKQAIQEQNQNFPKPSKVVAKEDCAPCTGNFSESDGLVIMEAENTSSDYDLWIKKTDVADYQGSGHLEFTGNRTTNGPPTSPLAYQFKINQAGTYRLIIRARKRLETDRTDISNDGFLRMEGDFQAGPDAANHASLSELKEDQKFFGGNANDWGFALRYDIDNSHKFRDAVYQFKAGQTYTLYVSGRSKNWNIDRIVIYDLSRYSLNEARNQARNGAESACSNSAPPPPPPPAPTKPAAPSNLQAQAQSTSQINLSWKDNSDNETKFRLEVSQNEGTSFQQLAELNANITQYQHKNLQAGKKYCYRVIAFNAQGDSPNSNMSCATTNAPPPPPPPPAPTKPAAPSNLQAQAQSTSQINLSWKDNSDNETKFRLEVSQNEGTSFQQLAELNANITQYQHKNLQAGKKYCYRVIAFNAQGDSPNSNMSCATTNAVPPPPPPPAPKKPAAPSNLQAQAQSTSQIHLFWKDNSDDETEFRLEVSEDEGSSFQQLIVLNVNTTEYLHNNLESGRKYCYRVIAVNAQGDSPSSNTACATTEASTPPPPVEALVPNAPNQLTAQATSASQIQLNWNDNADNEQGFYLERKGADDDFTQIATLAADQTSFSDKNLLSAQTYTYRLRAYNAQGESTYSNEASATTLTQVKVHNQITPNGDGLYDVLQIDNLSPEIDFSIRIFTRGGKMVYESKQHDNPWDGTQNGQALPNGVYYYVVQIGGGTQSLSGYITLVR